MIENNIQNALENLGEQVSKIAEENRVFKIQEDTVKELFHLITKNILIEDWVTLYESTTNIFLKDLMKDWGAHLFPKTHSF